MGPTLSAGATWAQGDTGPALSFPAAADYYNTNELVNQASAEGTVIWGLKPAFSPTDNVQHFMWGQSTGAGSIPVLDAQKDATNTWSVGWYAVGGDARVAVAASNANLTMGVWQVYAFTWSASGSVLYRNGLPLVSNALAAPVSAISAPFWIGNVSTSGAPLSGLGGSSLISFLYFYDRALSVAEIQWLYVAPYAMLDNPRPGPLSLIA